MTLTIPIPVGPVEQASEIAPMLTTIMRLPNRSGMRVVRSYGVGIIFQATRMAATR